MKTLARIVFMIIGVSFAASAYSGEKSWESLNSQFLKSYSQEQYPEAAESAKSALKVAEETFGPDHLNVATSLDNLALVYAAQGKYAEAEPFYKRALAIREKALGE